MPRVFFAAVLPKDIEEILAQLQSRLTGGTGAVKWVKKKNLHLTLQFLGDVSDAKLDGIFPGAEAAAVETAPFLLQIKGLGAFPGVTRPRVLWAGIDQGNLEIAALAARLSRSIGIKPDKPFSPHLTLGRVREGSGFDAASAFSGERDFSCVPFMVDRFACIESTLTPGGPVYRALSWFLLSGK